MSKAALFLHFPFTQKLVGGVGWGARGGGWGMDLRKKMPPLFASNLINLFITLFSILLARNLHLFLIST